MKLIAGVFFTTLNKCLNYFLFSLHTLLSSMGPAYTPAFLLITSWEDERRWFPKIREQCPQCIQVLVMPSWVTGYWLKYSSVLKHFSFTAKSHYSLCLLVTGCWLAVSIHKLFTSCSHILPKWRCKIITSSYPCI